MTTDTFRKPETKQCDASLLVLKANQLWSVWLKCFFVCFVCLRTGSAARPDYQTACCSWRTWRPDWTSRCQRATMSWRAPRSSTRYTNIRSHIFDISYHTQDIWLYRFITQNIQWSRCGGSSNLIGWVKPQWEEPKAGFLTRYLGTSTSGIISASKEAPTLFCDVKNVSPFLVISVVALRYNHQGLTNTIISHQRDCKNKNLSVKLRITRGGM